MFDWGGVWNDGYYTISFMTYKASGPFKLYSDFGIDDTVRHYAFPKGDEGISLLPILIRLPEDTRDFDVNSIKEAIKPTVFSQFHATTAAL